MWNLDEDVDFEILNDEEIQEILEVAGSTFPSHSRLVTGLISSHESIHGDIQA